jgi:cytoskeletal protein CcmA (bactofilin family)
MNPADGATIIGSNTTVRGEITGADNLLIEGEVEGTVTLPGGKVTIGAHGRVRATVFAQEIEVSGRLQGDALATGTVRLRSTAMVLGDVTAARFVMEEDAMLRGHVNPVPAALPGSGVQEKSGDEPGSGHAAASSADEQEAAPVTALQEPLWFARVPETAHRQHEDLPAGLAAAARQVQEATASPVGDHGSAIATDEPGPTQS